MTPAAGDQLGPYRIVRLIGAGGMGAVHEAVHVLLDKRVALKTLHGGAAEDATAVARFVEEGRAASRLRHPNVVDVTDVGVHEGTPYLVMELLEGESLAGRLAREHQLAAEQAVDLLLPIIDALAVAHDAGIVHRDLKPENIFLAASRSGTQPKLLDFGISRIVRAGAERLTQSATMLGTPCYMAPEQVRDAKTVDARSDVFSLGLVLYEMLAGMRAIRGDTVLEVLHRIMSVDVEPLRLVQPGVPSALARVVDRMLAGNAGDRFSSMRELGTALLSFASAAARGVWGVAFQGAAAPASLHAPVDPVGATGISASPRTATPCGERSPDVAPTGDVISELACPPLDVVGVEEPSGWLGASAAFAVGRRARWLLGGSAERVVGPAQLAGLSSEPSRQLPISPFDDAGVRDTARRAAYSRSGAVLAGSIERRRGRLLLRIRIELRGQVLARAESAGPSLASAARDAVVQLGESLGWRPIDESAVEVYGQIDPRDGCVLEDSLATEAPPDDPVALCAALPRLGTIGRALAVRFGEPPPDLDSASAASRAWTATARASAGLLLSAEVDQLLGRDTEGAQSLEARAVFRALAALRALQAGETERAWSLALRATSIDPAAPVVWEALNRATPRARMTEAHAWRVMTWAPDTCAALPSEPAANRKWFTTIIGRLYVLHGADEKLAHSLAYALVRTGELAAAESLAAELDESPSMWRAAVGARACVDLQQARFGRALTRLRGLLLDDGKRMFGGADVSFLVWSLGAAEILGQLSAVADEVLESVLLSGKRQLDPASEALDLALLATAECASPDVARLSLARLRALIAAHFFQWPSDGFVPLADAIEHLLAGRLAAVAGPIRPLASSNWFGGTLARLFDAGGAPELAARVDESIMSSGTLMYGGLSMAHVRAARRAAGAGRADVARALAARVVEAWAVADADVPLLGEMRALSR